jgi:hypothetical protein
MTHNKLLDAILSSYLFGLRLKLDKDARYKKLSFKLVAKAQEPTIGDWHIEFLKKRLFDDGFLENAKYGDAEPFELTPAGIKAAQSNWYSSNEEEKRLDKEIKAQTLLSLKRSKDAKVVSIFAIIVPTIISIYALWLTKQQDNTAEVKQLKQQLDAIRQEQLRQQATLHSLQTVSVDTTQKAKSDK